MANDVLIVDANGTNRNVGALDIGSGGVERLATLIAGAAPNPSVANLAALNAALVVSVAGMGSIALATGGVFSATVAFECCFDTTQTTWYPLFTSRVDTASTATSTTTTGVAYTAACDGGMTFVRMRVSAYTSGTVTATLAPGSMPVDPTPTVLLAGANSTRIGAVMGVGAWFDTTAVALAAAATFTGSSRDLANNTTGNSFGSGSFNSEYRISAESDQAGTLYLEVSRDNSTWRRIKGAATAAFDGTSVQYAEIIHKPSTRYARPVYINGATLQGQFMLQEYALAGV